jgi:hypothetical protein
MALRYDAILMCFEQEKSETSLRPFVTFLSRQALNGTDQ